ncbi:MAG: NADP-dependent oxidoreductase, partial [Pseudomonadota bacterium]
TSTGENRRITLAARPSGIPESSCWKLDSVAQQPPAAGQIMVRILYISVDPAMRGWINEGESYLPAVELGETMRALAQGQVVQSESDSFQPGDVVSGMFGVQEYATVDVDPTINKVDPSLAPLTTYLGVLGMPGMTAYFGLLEEGKLEAGDTLLVSGAAGAVGAAVGQIGKIHGARVVGIAGGEKKCAYLSDTLGFDAVIDYRAESDLGTALDRAVPEGIDVFFDNVGGETLDAALQRINLGARVVICGAISQYNAMEDGFSRIDYTPFLIQRATLTGFVILDYIPRYAEGGAAMAGWLQQGKLTAHEDVRHGLENFSSVFLELFTGGNFGKLILQVAEQS